MTGNTSASPGYLLPDPTTPPLDDDALTDFLQAVVVGITGLTGDLVRPRWQPEPPNVPDRGVTWAAVGITQQRPDDYAVELHSPSGDGSSDMVRHEELDLMCSFYGPAAGAAMGRLRDGLYIAQNREVLQLAGMGLVGVSDPTRAPDLLKKQWYARVDVIVTIRREIRRTYPVLNLLSAAGQIDTAVIDLEFDTQRVTP